MAFSLAFVCLVRVSSSDPVAFSGPETPNSVAPRGILITGERLSMDGCNTGKQLTISNFCVTPVEVGEGRTWKLAAEVTDYPSAN